MACGSRAGALEPAADMSTTMPDLRSDADGSIRLTMEGLWIEVAALELQASLQPSTSTDMGTPAPPVGGTDHAPLAVVRQVGQRHAAVGTAPAVFHLPSLERRFQRRQPVPAHPEPGMHLPAPGLAVANRGRKGLVRASRSSAGIYSHPRDGKIAAALGIPARAIRAVDPPVPESGARACGRTAHPDRNLPRESAREADVPSLPAAGYGPSALPVCGRARRPCESCL